jgi:lipid-binding SYLF domain-containing protein
MCAARRLAALAALTLAALAGCADLGRPTRPFGPGHELVNEAIGSLATFEPREFPAMRASLEAGCAVLIFPGVSSAAFLVGGAHGHGVLLERDAVTGGWHGPVFVSMSEIDLGVHVVAGPRDILIAVQSCGALDAFLANGSTVRLGLLMEAQAGENGATRQALAGVTVHSRMRGVNVGAAVNATMLRLDPELAQSFYGAPLQAREILAHDRNEDPVALALRIAVASATRRPGDASAAADAARR